jgi:chemotaxis protein CheX
VLLNGVRFAAIARAQGGKINEMEQTMAVSLRESVQLVSDPQNLDASVEEVFQMMLGVNCRRDRAAGNRAGVGHRGGRLWRPVERGLRLQAGSTAAMKIAAHMTGMEFEEIDDTSRTGSARSATCWPARGRARSRIWPPTAALSVPAVITGRDYNLHVQAPEFQLHHTYRSKTPALKSPSSAMDCSKSGFG